MDRRSWPWKKKSSSDKAAIEKVLAASETTGASVESAGKKTNYVQISVESYTHLSGLEEEVKSYEEQVKSLEDELKELNEHLSEAHSEMNAKENLVKQHAKVAEEAVSGWEKAEAEAAALKNHLESVTLLKLTAEDRATHLDGALKECMRQIRNLKEEHEQKLHDVVLAKTKQWDKIRLELESRIAQLEQDFIRSNGENSALSRSLQERSNMLIEMSEQKSRAEAEIEVLKSNIESCEREINSLKYELHIVAKELEIRNEEKNMSVRSAEVANRQHLEGVKKITKLEAECQRLRGLVRKKLPGPAALAQMKLEVESLGRDYGETRLRKSPVKPPNSHMPEYYHKENDLLTERLFSLEEETKMLKEALAKRNSELQTTRNICAKTASKLQTLEAQMHLQPNGESESNPPSLISMSEDGHDDDIKSMRSWATISVSEPKKEKNIGSSNLGLMDDFLEMEKLACLSNDSSEAISTSDLTNGKDLEPSENQSSHCDATSDHQVSSPAEKGTPEEKMADTIDQELVAAISKIHDFVMFLGNEANDVEEFSNMFNGVLSLKTGLNEFVLDLSNVLARASELRFNVLGYKNSEAETGSSDYIDKVALPENKVVQEHPSGEQDPKSCVLFSDSNSDPDVPHGGSLVPSVDSTATPWKCSLEEFEQLKLEKENLVMDLARCTENLESTKLRLQETEVALTEVRSELASAQKANGLAETQLKCMAESYKLLETRAEELQAEVNLLKVKTENFRNELQEEKSRHQDALARCKDLQEQLQRIESCPEADNSAQANQEKDLAAAVEKLAECQETIFLLSKQLKTFRPPTEFIGSPYSERSQKGEEETRSSSANIQDIDLAEMDIATSPNVYNNATFSPSDSEANAHTLLRSPINSKQQKHHSTKSGSSSSSSTPTPEKHARGFSRFFSSKGKNDH